MTDEQHRARHTQLHTALAELVADYVRSQEGTVRLQPPLRDAISQLLEWSERQRIVPDRQGTHLTDPPPVITPKVGDAVWWLRRNRDGQGRQAPRQPVPATVAQVSPHNRVKIALAGPEETTWVTPDRLRPR